MPAALNVANCNLLPLLKFNMYVWCVHKSTILLHQILTAVDQKKTENGETICEKSPFDVVSPL